RDHRAAEVRLRPVGRHGEPRQPAPGRRGARPGPGLRADGRRPRGGLRFRADADHRAQGQGADAGPRAAGPALRDPPSRVGPVRGDVVRKLLVTAVCVATALSMTMALSSCGTSGPGSTPRGHQDTIVVGVSGAFAENQLVAEMYAQVLENAGYRVERQF